MRARRAEHDADHEATDDPDRRDQQRPAEALGQQLRDVLPDERPVEVDGRGHVEARERPPSGGRSRRRHHRRADCSGDVASPSGYAKVVLRPRDVLRGRQARSAPARSSSGSSRTRPSSSCSSSRELTQRVIAVSPLRMPIPHGSAGTCRSSASSSRSGGRDAEQERVVEHERVGAAFLDRERGVREVVLTSSVRVLEAVRPSGRRSRRASSRPSCRRGSAAADRRVVRHEQAPRRLVVRDREVDLRVAVAAST